MPPSALERLAFAVWRRSRSRHHPPAGRSALGPGVLPRTVPWPGAQARGEQLALRLGAALDPDDRAWQRHSWFYGLTRAAAEVQHPAWEDLAESHLRSWLNAPQEQAARHGSDAALRVLAWAAGLCWRSRPLPEDLHDRLTEAVVAQVQYTLDHLNLRSDEADHRLIAQASALVVAGAFWPQLTESSRWIAEGLTLLGRALPAQLASDGAPLLSPPGGLACALECALLARAFATRVSAPWPQAADAALVRGAWFLRALGEGGEVPPMGEIPGPSPLAWGPSPWESAWNTVVRLGLDPGPAGSRVEQDGAAAWLGGGQDPQGASLCGESWSMLYFRDGGWAFVHGRVRGRPSRIVVSAARFGQPWAHADAGQVLWDLDGAPVLIDPGSWPGHPALGLADAHGAPSLGGRAQHARLMGARVDGREATVRVDLRPPSGAGLGLKVQREVKLNGARLVISDRVQGQGSATLVLRLPLGTGWRFTPTERGWQGERDTLRLDLSGEGPLSWTLEQSERVVDGALTQGPALVGRGTVKDGDRVRVKLDLR